jgi:hypothetical protein
VRIGYSVFGQSLKWYSYRGQVNLASPYPDPDDAGKKLAISDEEVMKSAAAIVGRPLRLALRKLA